MMCWTVTLSSRVLPGENVKGQRPLFRHDFKTTRGLPLRGQDDGTLALELGWVRDAAVPGRPDPLSRVEVLHPRMLRLVPMLEVAENKRPPTVMRPTRRDYLLDDGVIVEERSPGLVLLKEPAPERWPNREIRRWPPDADKILVFFDIRPGPSEMQWEVEFDTGLSRCVPLVFHRNELVKGEFRGVGFTLLVKLGMESSARIKITSLHPFPSKRKKDGGKRYVRGIWSIGMVGFSVNPFLQPRSDEVEVELAQQKRVVKARISRDIAYDLHRQQHVVPDDRPSIVRTTKKGVRKRTAIGRGRKK